MEDPAPNPFIDDTDPSPQQQKSKSYVKQVVGKATDSIVIASITGDVNIVHHHRETKSSGLKSNFIGREKEITEIQNLVVKQGSKIIVIQAAAGTGKTTLAEQYMESQGYNLIKLSMAKKTEDIDIIDGIVANWLDDHFKVKPVQDFKGNLSLLKRKLESKTDSQKIGILIDNLEPALDCDGKFIKDHRGYAELLKVLADSKVQSLTLITSRETLRENDICDFREYSLSGLSVEAWQKFFENNKIKADCYDIIKEINEAYGGNAKAMKLVAAQILLPPNNKIVDKEVEQSDLNQYWQRNKERLLRNKLDGLFEETFNRLPSLHSDAYRLLCRLGCYRYQKISEIPEEGLLSLLWDIPEEVDPINIIDSLVNYFLVEQKNNEYFLHPVIREKAISKIELNREEWKDTNKKIAEFYCKKARDVSQSNQVRVEYAFEAIYHYNKIGEYEKCTDMVLSILEAEENLENLRCSENLWSYIIRIIETCKDLTDDYRSTGESKLKGLDKAMILIPLGVLYPEMGKTNEAVKISEVILEIIENIPKYDSEDTKKIVFAKISAYLIAGRANKFLGNFPDAFKACDDAVDSVRKVRGIDQSTLNYWQGLAVYERGTVHLERAKLRDYSWEACQSAWDIIKAAFLALDMKQPPKRLYAYLITVKITEINKFIEKLGEFRDKYSAKIKNKERDKDYTKKFRIVYNFGRCLNLIHFYIPSRVKKFLLKQAESFLPDTDYLNKTWSWLELALCSSKEDAIKYYKDASEENNFSYLTTLCQASVLFEYANFKYKDECYVEAINKYLELENFLEKTGLESLKALNYNSISEALSMIPDDKRGEINGSIRNKYDYSEDIKKICKSIKLDLSYVDKTGKNIQ